MTISIPMQIMFLKSSLECMYVWWNAKLTRERMKLDKPEGSIKILFNDPVRFLYRLTVIK